MKLTTANVDLPGGKSGLIYWDDDLIGFGLRLRRGSGGRVIRSWLVAYRAHGRQRRPSISADSVSAKDARKWAKEILAKVELGQDPQADKTDRQEQDRRTLKWVARRFVEENDAAAAKGEIKPRTADSKHHYLLGPRLESNRRRNRGNVESWLKPLHNVPIDKITIGDISASLAAAEKRSGKGSAIALRSVTSELFSWAMREGYAAQNPVINARQVKPVKARDRVLTPSELVMIWRNLADDDYGKCTRLLISCGARRSEIGGIRFREFDDPDNPSAWTLPKERSKNGLAHTLPIVSMMREIILSVPQRDGLRGGDVLFGFGKRGFQGWHLGKRALDAKLDLPPWRLHDVRRSVATGMANIGIMPHIIEQILNHQSGHKAGPAGVYNLSVYQAGVADALQRWQHHLASLLADRAPKVVPFERASGAQ
jgi:integrase